MFLSSWWIVDGDSRGGEEQMGTLVSWFGDPESVKMDVAEMREEKEEEGGLGGYVRVA